jgi:hypothetical protein
MVTSYGSDGGENNPTLFMKTNAYRRSISKKIMNPPNNTSEDVLKGGTINLSRNSDRGVIPSLSLLVGNASFVLTRSVGNAHDGRLENLVIWCIKHKVPRKENVLTWCTQGDDNAILTDVLDFQLASGHLDVTDHNHARAQILGDCVADPSPRTGIVSG